MIKMTLTVGALVLVSAAALAGTTPRYTATLAQPIAGKKEIVANENLWRCEGATCVLTSKPVDADSVRSCHKLQHQVGALTAYGVEGKEFDADKLASCNTAH